VVSVTVHVHLQEACMRIVMVE